MRERIVALIILALAATACGTAPGLAPVGSSGGPSSAGSFAVPTVPGQQLAAGMIKLDGTPYGVTPQEAAKLVPLWKALQQTEQVEATAAATRPTPSGTGTPGPRFNQANLQQVSAEVVAIENAMPADQLQAISQMNLNRQDVADILQRAGIQMGSFGGFEDGTFVPPNGTPRAFGTPRDFGTPGTPGAFFRNGGSGARGAFASFIPPTVVDGVIQWLQKKASSS